VRTLLTLIVGAMLLTGCVGPLSAEARAERRAEKRRIEDAQIRAHEERARRIQEERQAMRQDVDRLCTLAFPPDRQAWCVDEYGDEWTRSYADLARIDRALNDCLVRRFDKQSELLRRCVDSRLAELNDRERDRRIQLRQPLLRP